MLYPSSLSLSLPLVPLSPPVPLSLAGRGLCLLERTPETPGWCFWLVVSEANRWKLSCEATCMIIEYLCPPPQAFIYILNCIPKALECAIMSWMDVAQVAFT